MEVAPAFRTVPLGGSAREIAVAEDGRIFALVATVRERFVLCLSPDGEVLGRADLAGWHPGLAIAYFRPPLRLAGDGTAWVSSGAALVRLAADGRQVEAITVAQGEESLGSFVLLSDGFLVSLYGPPEFYTNGWDHTPSGNATPGLPAVMRLGANGSLIWRMEISYDQMRAARHGATIQPVWGGEPLLVSGDLALASFTEIEAGISQGFCLDLASGEVRWTTEAGPQHCQAILGHENFLIGSQGYGEHHMTAHAGDGRVESRWEEQALVVIGADGAIAGPEMDNSRRTQQFFRFGAGGTVESGPSIEGYYSSYPALTSSGWVVFWREHEGLVAIGPDGTKRTLFADVPDQRAHSRAVITPSGTIVLGFGQDLLFVPSDLGPLAQSPWPCAGLNGRNNPVARLSEGEAKPARSVPASA